MSHLYNKSTQGGFNIRDQGLEISMSCPFCGEGVELKKTNIFARLVIPSHLDHKKTPCPIKEQTIDLSKELKEIKIEKNSSSVVSAEVVAEDFQLKLESKQKATEFAYVKFQIDDRREF